MRSITRSFSALTAASVLLCCSCGNKTTVTAHREQTEIKLSWWGNDDRNEYTIEAVRRFEHLHPDIKVKCSYSEWSGYEARSRVQMNSDTEADVMQINYGWLSQYSKDGTGYYDLDKLSDKLDLSQFSDDMLEYGRVCGILNAVPIAMNIETPYYNKTIYDKYGLELPKTWDDLFDCAEVMRKDGIYPTSGTSKSIWLFLISYAEQVTGKELLSEDGDLQFSADDFRIMIDMYCDMIDEKVIPQVEFYDRTYIDSGIYGGTVAWVSDALNYCEKAQENGFEMVVGDYTASDASLSGSGWDAKPATMYAVSRNTDHPEEAAMLLDFLLNSSDMAYLQGVEKGIPLSNAARKYLEEENMLSGIQYDASLRMENNKFISTLDPFKENGDVIDSFFDKCDLVIYDKSDSQLAASDFYNQFKVILRKNK